MAKKKIVKKSPPRFTAKRKAIVILVASYIVFASAGLVIGQSHGIESGKSQGCQAGVSALATNIFGQAPQDVVARFCEEVLAK